MTRPNFSTIKTTGSRGLDEQLRQMQQRVSDLEARIASLSASQQQASSTTASTISGDVEGKLPGPVTVRKLQGVPISGAAPTNGQVLTYNATAGQWVPT